MDRADFKNRIKISESEASETIYWLDIIEDLNWINKEELEPLTNESNELLAVFTSISRNIK